MTTLYRTPIFRSLSLGALAFALIMMVGCDSLSTNDDDADTDPTPSTYTVSGTIENSTERGVKEAEVQFILDGTTAHVANTDDTGAFTVQAVSEGQYQVSVTASGYDELSFSVNIDGDVTIPTKTLLGGATLTGTVTDAATGEPRANAEVAFTFDEANADTSRTAADLLVTTDTNGQYTISNAPIGTFIVVIRVPGYIVTVIPDVEIVGGSNDLGTMSASERLEEGQVRIVLEWGEIPGDLDSHLTGPDGNGDRFHVYFASREPTGANANLDVDDVSSYGPETITIDAFRSGVYRYSVHNFSDQSENGAVGIDASPARITVYDEGGQVATYTPPDAASGQGNTWRVFEIDGDTRAFTDGGGATLGYQYAENTMDMNVF